MASASSSSVGLFKRRILLAVTGSIAAYKAPMLLRQLQKAGAEVEVVMTESAQRFVGAATFSGLGARVHSELWSEPGELHVRLAAWADAVLIAPCTADTLSRLAQGRADDLLTATVLCTRAPLLLAPALHPTMWRSPATQANVETLRARGARFVGPAVGEVASGDSGEGRLEEPETILQHLERAFPTLELLRGRRVVVTAGPTRERLDPVRYLTNDSSGKMGFSLADQAARLGADVTLIAGPVALGTPPGVRRVDIESALELERALDQALGADLSGADVVIMAAAVADYRPAQVSKEKLKRSGQDQELALCPNPDILGAIGRKRTAEQPLLVGFALETAQGDQLISLGRSKLIDKRVDLIVANEAVDSLGRDDNRVLLVSAQDCKKLERLPKPAVAREILEWVARRLNLPPLGEFSA